MSESPQANVIRVQEPANLHMFSLNPSCFIIFFVGSQDQQEVVVHMKIDGIKAVISLVGSIFESC